MKTRKLRELLNEALIHAKFERCDFKCIGGDSKRLGTAVRMAEGSLVTEAKVNDFIWERTRIYRHSWIIGLLAEALRMIEAETPHKWEPRSDGVQTCAYCNFGPKHRLHKVR